jgi:hypothetical protein
MKYLTDVELKELSTKRLLALYKKVREIFRKRDSLLSPDHEYNDETVQIMFYKDRIKQILNTREDV